MSKQIQVKKAEQFRTLHLQSEMLLLPNVWDAGGAKIIADLGFPALATTSAGVAFFNGYPDGEKISRDRMLQAIGEISERIAVPLTADIEAGYGRDPETVSETIEMTVAAGAVGVNLEDGAVQGSGTLLDVSLATERLKAARAGAENAGVPVVINARTDGYFEARNSDAKPFNDTVERGNAYMEAGADCVFVFGVQNKDEIAKLVNEINGPINIVAGAGGLSVPELADLGVKRVSLGGGLARASLGFIRESMEALMESGEFKFLKHQIPHYDLNKIYSDS